MKRMTSLTLWFFTGVLLGMLGGMFWIDEARASIFDSIDTLKNFESESTKIAKAKLIDGQADRQIATESKEADAPSQPHEK